MLLLASSSPPLPSSRTQVSMESLAWLRSPFWGESPAHYLHRALFVFPFVPFDCFESQEFVKLAVGPMVEDG